MAIVLILVVSLSSAASAKNPRGSAKWCAHHPKSTLAGCRTTGGGGSGGSPPPANVTVSPNPVLETGGSDVYAVLSVATDPVYAEQTVEVVSGIGNRCRGGALWVTDQGEFTGSAASATIDNDGHATFTLLAAACAAGPVTVIADVLAGTDPTYSTTFTIDPPAPGI